MESAIVYSIVCLWLCLFGACTGSFINVVVYRLPKGNFFAERRSFCPACRVNLTWRDLLPIVSWLRLKGRCRYCGAGISSRYPIVETACSLLAVLCFARFGFDVKTIAAFGVTAVLLAVALIDYDTMEIPHTLIAALIPFAVSAVWISPDVSLLERGIGFFAVSLPMLLITLFINNAFGGGDIKLMAVCGFLLGWQNTLLAFFIALITGGAYSMYLLIRKKSKPGAHIAFGPYLCLGAAVSVFRGTELIRLYLNLFI